MGKIRAGKHSAPIARPMRGSHAHALAFAWAFLAASGSLSLQKDLPVSIFSSEALTCCKYWRARSIRIGVINLVVDLLLDSATQGPSQSHPSKHGHCMLPKCLSYFIHAPMSPLSDTNSGLSYTLNPKSVPLKTSGAVTRR